MNASYKVKIISAVLLVRKMQLNPSGFYPIRRIVCKTYTIQAENLDGNHEKLFTGQPPSRLVIGCVDKDTFNGSYRKNPYNLNNFAWSEISIRLDGNIQPIGLLKPNYASRQYIQAYKSLFS